MSKKKLGRSGGGGRGEGWATSAELLEAGHRTWMAHAAVLGRASATEIHGSDPTAHASDARILCCMADFIFWQTRGLPCWGALAVDAWIAGMARSADWNADRQAQVVIAAIAFYTWLVNNGHLRFADAIDVLRGLERHVNQPLRDLGYTSCYGEKEASAAASPEEEEPKMWN
jgi:hypothetical protein